VDYQKTIHKSEIGLQIQLTQALENQAHTDPSASTHGSPPPPEQPSPECGSERRAPTKGPNDPIELKKKTIYFELHIFMPSYYGLQCFVLVHFYISKCSLFLLCILIIFIKVNFNTGTY